jgi:hypothetical protein
MTENLQADPIETIDNSIENAEVNQVEEVKTDEVKPETKEAEEVKETKEYPDDWREKIAKDDEKVLKKLQRLKTPEDLAKSYLELEKKFSETRAKFQLPENPTPEDIVKYREENGVPEKAEGYDLNLDGGLVIGEYDKPIIDEFVKIAHDKNMPAGELKKAVQSYFEARTKADAKTTKFIEKTTRESEAELKANWGDKITENKNKIATFMESQFGADEARLLDQAILPDGTSLATNPKLLNKFLALANNFHQVPSDTATNSKVSDINTEIADLQQMIREGTYYKNPANPKRMAELTELKAKMKL